MRPRGSGDSGGVTAETALAMPAVGLVAAALVGVGQVSVAQLRCIDAARAGVRLAARGEPTVRVVARAASVAPVGAVVAVRGAGGEVVVTVRSRVDLPFGIGIPIGSRAVADVESELPSGGVP
ncbi:MAG: TadE family type IV pilus minor pilin [Kineosporiaceae bacterium]